MIVVKGKDLKRSSRTDPKKTKIDKLRNSENWLYKEQLCLKEHMLRV